VAHPTPIQRATALASARKELACEAARRRAANAAEQEVTRRARRQAGIATLGQRALAGAKGVTLATHAVEIVTRILGASSCEFLTQVAEDGRWRTVAVAGKDPTAQVGAVRRIGPGTFLGQALLSHWPIVSSDLLHDERLDPAERSNGPGGSAVAVAIPGGDAPTRGLLYAVNSLVEAFDDEDGRFLQAMSFVLATARTRSHVESKATAAGGVLTSLTEASAHGLDVARASIWLFDPGRTKIVCADLFTREPRAHETGHELLAGQFPSYFEALATEGTIAAPDAQVDTRTAEFTESYLKPLGIGAMLDVPIWIGGEMIGVLCHEHVGGPRLWSHDDEEFAYMMGSLVARAIERHDRHRQIAA
jgi:GAF domain-containing protein